MTGKMPQSQEEGEKSEFYNSNIGIALANCQKESNAMFMNKLILKRINAPLDSRIWQIGYVTPSLKATGRTLHGSKVVVYAHCPNYLSNPRNIIKAKNEGLIDYAARIPQDAFQALVDMDGKKDKAGNRLVWVVDYKTLKGAKTGVLPVDSVLEHPQTIPFAGGEFQAEEYMKMHRKYHGNKISNQHSDDFNEDSSLGRLLGISSGNFGGFIGDYCLNNSGRFLGDASAETKPRKKSEIFSGMVRTFARNLLASSRKQVESIIFLLSHSNR